MQTITVTTKEELKKAQEEKVQEIIVSGDLADKLKKAKQITKLGATGLGILTAALGIGIVAAPVTGGLSMFAAAPVTGGLSMFAAAPVAALTGLEIAAIITASALGIALIIAVFKDYEEISFEKGKMTLKKRQVKND